MATYEVELRGKRFEVEADNERAAVVAAQRAMLLPPTRKAEPTPDRSNLGAGDAVVAANAARAGIERAAMQTATSPNLGRAIKAVTSPAAQMAGRAAGISTGSLPGYVLGETVTNPAVGRVLETGIRSGAGAFARLMGSATMRALTGPYGAAAGMVTEFALDPKGVLARKAEAERDAVEAAKRLMAERAARRRRR